MKVYTNILEFVKRYPKFLTLSLLCTCFSALVGVVPYFALYDVINKAFSQTNIQFNYIVAVSVVILAGLLFKPLLLFKGLDFSHQLAYFTLHDIRTALADKFIKLPMGIISRKGHGEIKKIFLEDIEDMELIFAHHIPEGISNIAIVLIVSITMLYLNWRMALLCIATLAIGILIFMAMASTSKKKMGTYYESAKKMNDTIIEYINGMEAIKVFNQTTNSFEKYTNTVKNYLLYTRDWYKVSWKYISLYGTILSSTLLLLLPAGVVLYLQGSLSLAKMILLILLAMSLETPLLRIVDFLPAVYKLNYKSQKILNLLNEKELYKSNLNLTPENYDISFEDVTFGYWEKDVIKNINISFKQNSLNALVGASGAGKSTLAKLIVRFWDVENGDIKIGNVSIKDIKFDDLMSIISYVSQDNFLFNTSIEENIRIGKPNATEEEVISAAKAAGCHEFIIKTERGYKTKVGGSGNMLSGGEKQRITIARAILKNAPIIILDEATSSTDPENEDKIQQVLSKLIKGKTVIIIAHRLSTITQADKIIVMDAGQVSACGTHNALLKSSKIYKKLWNSYSNTTSWNIGGTKSHA